MFVLDASALAKLFLDEPGSTELREWVEKALQGGTDLRAPHLAFSEIGRIIQKEKRGLSAAEAKELHESVFLGLQVDPLDADSLRVWDFCVGSSYHDAEYIELAEALGATLVTADQRQLEAATRANVETLSFVPGAPKARRRR